MSADRILLIGASGQLGADLHAVLSSGAAGKNAFEVLPKTRADLDVCDPVAVEAAIGSLKPAFVINTAAFHDLEECERDPARAFSVNAIAARDLARSCHRHGSVLVHFSTDFVFDGRPDRLHPRRPYREDDLPHPLSAYAASKLAGEHLIAMTAPRSLVIRTCGLFGHAGSRSRGGNFVDKVLTKARSGEPLRVVDDQVLTPSFTADVALAVAQLLSATEYGLYHLTNEGECSWYQLTQHALHVAGINADLRPVKTSEFPSSVQRPAWSVLSKAKAYAAGVRPLPSWQNAVERYLAGKRR